jgi:hypothetical protein
MGEIVPVWPLQREDWPALFAAASAPLIRELHPARDRYKEVNAVQQAHGL